MDARSRNNVVVTGPEDGTVVMLSHGFGCDQNLWRLVVPALAERFRVVIFDHVGAGGSDLSAWSEERYASLAGYADDVLEICRELDLRRVVFVGHSVSAMIGVLAAIAEPERFAGLVLLTPSPRYVDDGDYRGGFSAADIDELLESLDSNYLGWSAAMAPVIMGNPDRPELGEELTNSFCRTDPRIARVFARATFLSDNRADLAERDRADAGHRVRAGRDRPARGGRVRARRDPRQPAGHPGRHRALPAAERAGGDRRGDRRVRRRHGVMAAGTDPDGDRQPAPSSAGEDGGFSALLEDVEDLYENAPCGYLSTLLDGTIAKINATLLGWLGYARDEVVGRRRFADLLTVGGRIYHETHFAPLLRMQGEIGGVALELLGADGRRLPVLVTSTVKTGADGEPLLIRTTVFDARDRRSYERELLRARQDADRERDRFRRLATTLQRTLLPPALPDVPGMETAAYYHVASPDEVGGDFYDLFPLAGDRWGLFLGDVCGKGAGAAAVTSLARYTLRAAAVYDPDPVAVLTNLNTVLNHEYHGDDPRFCTVIFGLLTPTADGATITLASGGHPPALLLRADGTADYQPTVGGQLVGALPRARFTAVTLRLTPGDTLLLYTDGLTEARIGAQDHYGEAALRDFAAALAPTTAPAAITAVRSLLTGFGDGLDDDTAVLAVSVPAR